MPDPFSVISGAAGVVSLGLTVCQGLVAYYGPFVDFNTETQAFVTRVKGLSASLELLQSRVSGLQSPGSSYILDELQLVSDRTDDCGAALRKLEEALNKCRGYDSAGIKTRGWAFARAQYPFKRQTLVSLTDIVAGVQTNLEVAMQLLLLALTNRIEDRSNMSLTVSKSIASSTANVETTLGRIENTFEQGQQQLLQMVMTMQQTQLAVIDQSAAARLGEPLLETNIFAQQTRRRRLLKHRQTHTILGTKTCTCKRSHSGFFRAWGFLSAIRSHRFGCPMYFEREVTTLVNRKLVILNRFIGYSADINLTISRQGGGWDIAPAINLRCVVPFDAPAFEIMRSVAHGRVTLDDALVQLRRLFDNGEASPRDTTCVGETLLAVIFCNYALPDVWCHPLFSEFLRTLVLEFQVPLNEPYAGWTALDMLLTDRHVSRSEVSVDEIQAVSTETCSFLIEQGAVISKQPVLSLDLLPGYPTVSILSPRPDHRISIIGKKYGWGELDFSALETAIWERSEENVKKCLLQCDPEDIAISALAAVFWPRGLELLLSFCTPFNLFGLLMRAIAHRQFEPVKLILDQTQCQVSRDMIYLAAKPMYYDSGIFNLLAQTLAGQRRRMAEHAQKHLSPSQLKKLGLGSLPTVMDFQNAEIERELSKAAGFLSIDPGFYLFILGRSVYVAIQRNLDAAKALYYAGFTDPCQLDDQGFSPLHHLQIPTSDPARTSLLDELLKMCDWFIDKGCSLLTSSSAGALQPVHTIAREIGRNALYGHSEQTIQWHIIFERHSGLLQRVFGDTQSHDSCVCACSVGGCLPMNTFLRPYHRYIYSPHGVSLDVGFADMLDGKSFGDILCNKFQNTMAPVVIRFCTFEELGLQHTCRSHFHGHPEYEEVDLEDVAEVQQEEHLLITQLEELVTGFVSKYEELQVSLQDFLRGYWRDRMDEVLNEDNYDEEEARAMREVGIIVEVP